MELHELMQLFRCPVCQESEFGENGRGIQGGTPLDANHDIHFTYQTFHDTLNRYQLMVSREIQIPKTPYLLCEAYVKER